MKKILIFDTTLRDGEQTPGVNYSIEQKIEIAKKLEELKVDIIEAGFPITSKADFEACKAIGKEIKNSRVIFLARLNKKDIDCAYEAAMNNPNVMIHVFIASSKIHLEHKLKMSEDQLLTHIKEMVAYAKSKFKEVEFSCEDASRSDYDFLVKCYQMAIDQGATTINIPDTVGYATPDNIFELVNYLKKYLKADGIVFSTHIHQDLGLATANSLAAIKAGCNQVECAINGLGERAGNTALEEIVCALKLHQYYYRAYTDIDLSKINDASILVAKHSNVSPQPNKAIVGKNAFLHESGIHQDGFLKARETYEIINPNMIGKSMQECLVVGKHSGKHAMKDWLEKNNYPSDDNIVGEFFTKVKQATDIKKNLSINDLHTIIKEILHIESQSVSGDYKVKKFKITYNEDDIEAKVIIENEKGEYQASYIDKTPIRSLYEAINKAISYNPQLVRYHIEAISLGNDAKGMVEVKIKEKDKEAIGYGLSQDILFASVDAYINAINKVKGT